MEVCGQKAKAENMAFCFERYVLMFRSKTLTLSSQQKIYVWGIRFLQNLRPILQTTWSHISEDSF